MHFERLRVDDPGYVALRRGIRIAVVLPASMVLCSNGLDNPVAALYAAFGAFAFLVFADFGGPPKRRVLAYAGLTAIGAVLIVVGVAAAQTLPTAVLAMAVVGWGVALSTVLRGYVAGGAPAAQLAFVLSVTVGGDVEHLLDYLLGWLVAAVLSVVAALVLWPGGRREQLRHLLAAATRDTAAVVRSLWVTGADEAAAQAAVGRLREAHRKVSLYWGGLPFRPGGATRRDRALVSLVDQVARSATYLGWVVQSGAAPASGLRESDRALAAESAQVLEDSADALEGRGSPPDLDRLQADREQHLRGTQEWIATTDLPPDRIVQELEAMHPLRISSYLAAFTAGDTAAAVGVGPGGDIVAVRHQPTSWWQAVRSQLALRSPYQRNALRAGLGLALAVLVAGLTGVQHGFWVVLGTISVLRTDARATTRTALSGIGGTTLGFVIATAVLWLVGDNQTVLWLLLPITAALAGWAPAAVSFPVGQAAFTLAILIMFAVLSGPDLGTGVVRVEDVALGAAVSLVVGLALWPRGVVVLLRRSVAVAYRGSADYLVAALARLCRVPDAEPEDDVPAARRRGDEDVQTARDVFEQAMAARGGTLGHAVTWGRLISGSEHVMAVADLLANLGARGYQVNSRAEADEVLLGARDVRAALDGVADRLESGGSAPGVRRARGGDTDDPGGDVAPAPMAVADRLVGQARDRLAAGDRSLGITVDVWVADWLRHIAWVGDRALSRTSVLRPAGGPG
ncbi:MAG: FUSC family protein [Candidatus Nanopelagicales bacterium]